MTLTRHNTKIVIEPVFHEVGPRVTRRTWAGAVTLLDDETTRRDCGHHGHRTTDAAKACAMRIWRQLPEAV